MHFGRSSTDDAVAATDVAGDAEVAADDVDSADAADVYTATEAA